MHSLNQVMKKAFTPEKRAEIRRKAKEKVAAIRLQHLREIRHITQERIANSMGISQAALSRLERRPNITIGALQRYVEALGGRLEVRAVFKEETQQILE